MSNNIYKAALIIIGNEILSGRTEDKNLNYIAKQLESIGIRLLEVRVIPDIEQVIIDTVIDLKDNFDYIFTTGGIGPTHDDITTESVAAALNLNVIRSEEAASRMQKFYNNLDIDPDRKESILKMANIPEGAQLIDNPISSAPGYNIENIYVFAGIPNIMQVMFECVKDTLKTGKKIISKEYIVELPESAIAKQLTNLQNKFNDLDIGSYPFKEDNKFKTSIVFRGTEKSEVEKACDELDALLNM